MTGKVVVAMSGGVDSSDAALLLQQQDFLVAGIARYLAILIPMAGAFSGW